MASCRTQPPREGAAPGPAPVQHVDLPDDWRGDIEKPREEWCPICLWDGVWEHLFVRSKARTERFGRIFARSMLWMSASEGHLCCAVLLSFLEKVGGGKYDCFAVEWSHRRGVLVAFELEQQNPEPIVGADGDYSRWKLLIVGYAPGPPGMFGCRTDDLPSLDTGSETSVAWARDRINECFHNHLHSHTTHVPNAPGSYIPSRLLYIPPVPMKGIILRLKKSVPSGVKYVALSHCWGSREKWPRCLTTNANYESQLRHIAWDTLPRTFRDTAIFARKIGLGYIWIDSICIIQGDEKDWQRESTQMYSVYSNAYITFAALHAHDSHVGLFSRRAPGSLVPLLTLGFQGKQYHVQAYSVPDERRDVEMQVDQRSSVDPYHPLLNRAWAFQERLVSPRVLFFGLEELIWACPTGRACEEDTYSPPLWSEVDDLGIERSGTFMHKYNTITDTPDEMATQWLRIVQSYNDMELSEPTDRLPAIAAIAQRFAQCDPDDEYICGLWEKSIHQGLTLRFDMNENLTGPHIDFGPSAMVQSRYIAPSWSWASVQGRFYGEYWVTCPPSAEIVNVNLRYMDNDQFGRVAPGSSITLKGRVLDCEWNLEFDLDETLKTWQILSIPCTEGTLSCRFLREYATYSGLGQQEVIKVCLLLVGIGEEGAYGVLILRRISEDGHYFRLGVLNGVGDNAAFASGLTRALKEAPVRECVIE